MPTPEQNTTQNIAKENKEIKEKDRLPTPQVAPGDIVGIVRPKPTWEKKVTIPKQFADNMYEFAKNNPEYNIDITQTPKDKCTFTMRVIKQ